MTASDRTAGDAVDRIAMDHIVIAVRDLESARETFARAGFNVVAGGRHEGRGTHNALVPFADGSYLELLSFYDRALAAEVNPKSVTMGRLLDGHGDALLGYALSVSSVEQVARPLEQIGISDDVVDRRRIRPDGFEVTWRLLVPTKSAWRKVWPFFIEWSTPWDQRFAQELDTAHPNGVGGIAGLNIAAGDIEVARACYASALGFQERSAGDGDAATFVGGGFWVRVVEAPGGASTDLDDGLVELRLHAAEDVEAPAELPAARSASSGTRLPLGDGSTSICW